MKPRCAGFTMVETMVAVTLAVLFIGAGSTAFLYMLKSESIASTQAELDIDVRRAAERLKNQMRLSGLNEMVFYPQTPVGSPAAHLSVGFPLPGTDADGLVVLTESGRIDWQKSVIIHPWPPDRQAARQLRITTFDPRDPSLSDIQRFEQITRVTLDGDAHNTYNNTNATTITIFDNLFNWGIRPLEALYEGYAPQRRRDHNVTLGSTVMGPGINRLTVTMVGRDAQATGDKLNARLDLFRLTPSYLPREAEALDVETYDGPQPQAIYEANAIYSANHQLEFAATATNQFFTLLFENDCWEKLTFRNLGDLHRGTDVIFDKTLNPRRYAVKLAGMIRNWEATTQSGTTTPTTGIDLHNDAIRVLLRGHEMENGGFASLLSAGCRIRFQVPNNRWWSWIWYPQGFRIDSAYLAESADHVNPSPDIDASTLQQLTFNGSPSVILNYDSSHTNPLFVESDVVPLEIDPNKSYIVSVAISRSESDRLARPHYWESTSSTLSTYRYPAGGSDAATETVWSDNEDLESSPRVYLVESLFSTYAPEGVFESQIADTRIDEPQFASLQWGPQTVPDGTTMEVRIRSGAQPDLSDAPAWSNVVAEATSPSLLFNLDEKRYVQFQVRMTSNADGTESPRFERMKLSWPGPEQIVDIGGAFTQAPDSGRFTIQVNGQPLKTGVIVDLELYRDIRGFMQQGHQRLSSGIVAEVTPRNTRWDPDEG